MRAPDGHDDGGTPPVDNAPAVDPAPQAETPPAGDPPADPPEGDPAPLTADEQAAKDAADKEAADKDAAEFQPHGAPEGDYEFNLPEGVEVDKPMLDVFVPLAKELDLSPAGAQKLVEMYIEKVQPSIAEAFVKGIEADVENQKAQFAADTKALIEADAKADKAEDRVFQGKNFDAVVKTTARTLDRFGTPELRQFLNESGLGNHPELVKLMYKVGERIGEDNEFARGGQVPQERTREQKYYGG